MKNLRFNTEKELNDFLNRARAITATSPGVASTGTPLPEPPTLEHGRDGIQDYPDLGSAMNVGLRSRVSAYPDKGEKKNDRQIAVSFANLEPPLGHAPLGTQETPRLDTPCRLHIHSRRHRLTDPDGISAKAAIDGLVLAGVLPDDSAQCVSQVTFSQEKIGSQEIEETVIEIMEG
jgi:hypothetical protein